MRGLISMVIVGVIGLTAVAVIALGPRTFEGVLPETAVGLLEDAASLVPIGPGAARTGDTPDDFLDDTRDGLLAAGPIAALAGNKPVFLADVIAGYTTKVASDIPAEITTIRPIMGCLLTPPRDGSVVGYVTSDDSDLPLALSTYNDVDLAGAVQGFVDQYRKTLNPEPSVPNDIVYRAYDVAVTETSAPVYLVLEAKGGHRIWNIHLAPGAQIERVILLGGDQAGVANVDAVVPVEVLLDAGLDDCGIAPAHALNPAHRLLQRPAEGAGTLQEAEAARAAHAEAVEAYGRWLRDSFGIDAPSARAGFDRGTISVVGPVPADAETKAVYAPILESRMQTTRDTFFEIKGQVAVGEDFAARVKAIATSFAFGDLSNLRQGASF